MRPKPLAALLALVVVAGCSGDGEGDAAPPTSGSASGCPVAAAVVAEAVGHAVTIERGQAPGSCAFVGEDGGRVEVDRRDLTGEGFGAVLAEVERRSGPTAALDTDRVDGAERGWVGVVGRAVQVGAAAGETLVVVAVVEPLLDADAAEEVATRLAGEALSG